MIRLAISVPGQFYSEAITKALERTGNFRVLPLEVQVKDEADFFPTGGSMFKRDTDVVLLGVSVHQRYTLEERRGVIRKIRERAPGCRIVLFLDEQVSPEQTEGVKNLRQARLIDGFLYASGTMEYLVATLESI